MTKKYCIYKPGPRKFTKEQRIESFWDKVINNGPNKCWGWRGHLNDAGYPGFWGGDKGTTGCRFSLELKLGRKLKPGEHALHTCDNPICTNPKHLFSGTNDDNIRDKVKKGRQRGGVSPETASHGEDHFRSKLTDKKVRSIRKSNKSCRYLAAKYGVSPTLISMVKRKLWWKHVK